MAILLVRYSVARTRLSEQGKQSPELTAPFEVPNIPLPDSARYGLRLLRPGYLYTYMEWSGQWMCHAVSEEGFLAKISITQTPPDLSGVKACTRMANSQGGRYLVIDDLRDPASLGKLWLTFSPAHWTMDVFHRFKSDQVFREQNMRPLDLSAWCSSTAEETADQPYIARAEKALPLVAECALRTESLAHLPAPEKRKNPRPEAYSHGLNDWIGFNKQQVSNLETSMGRACVQSKVDAGMPTPQPLVIALDDPAALTADLNQLILEEQMIWSEDSQRKPQFASASGISILRQLVHLNAVNREAESRMAKIMAPYYHTTYPPGRISKALPPKEPEPVTFEEAQKLGEASWNTRYRRWLKGNTDKHYQQYLELYQQEMALFEKDVIYDLDTSYVAWLDSPALKQQMAAHFGQESVGAWIAYSVEVSNFLENSTVRNQTNEYLKKCLEQDPASPASFVLRSMMFNADVLIAVWKSSTQEASGSVTEGSELPWNATAARLITAYAGAVDPKIGAALFSLASRLLYVLGRPLMEYMGSQSQRTQTIASRLSFGWLAFVARLDKPDMKIVPMQWAGDMLELRNGMARVIGGTQSTSKEIAGSVLKRSGHQIKKLPVDIEFFMVFDEDELRTLRENLPADKNARHRQFAEAIQFKRYDDLFAEGILKPRGGQVKLNSVGSFLAALNVISQYSELKKVTAANKVKILANFTEAHISLVGISAETLAAAAADTKFLSQQVSSRLFKMLFGNMTRAKVLATCGRWLTGIGAMIGGVMTIFEGAISYKYSRAYGAATVMSGIIISISGVLILAGIALFLVGILLVCAVLLTLAVSWIKPDDIEKWLARAMFFGNGTNDGDVYFSSVVEQQEELEVIIKG